MRLKLFIMLLLAAAIPAIAQDSGVRGAVVDADSGMPVVGATVLLNQGVSAVTGLNGDFQITNASPGDETLTVIAYGYNDIVKDVTLFAKQTVDLGQLKMTPEVSSNAGNVVILDDNQLEDEEGNDQSIGVLSGASDNIFYNASNYDFSTMRFRARGYDQEYGQMYINGVHFTDAVRGRFSYSSLGGMNQAFKNRSVAVGLGASSFSLGDVGGAQNINTMAGDYAKGLRGNVSYTNGAYTTRAMLTYSTGLLDNGWAFTLSAIGRYSKEGVQEGTFYHSAGLFLSLQKMINEKHSIGLTAFGAPTERATSSATTEEAYLLADNYLYNPNWGWQDGKKRSAKVVNSFDPTAIINWIWKPKTGTSLNTGVAWRHSTYSSSALNWNSAPDPRPDYYRYLPSYYVDNPEMYELYTELWQNDESQRQIDWESLYRANYYGKREAEIMHKDYEGATYMLEDRHSDMSSFLFNSTFNHRLNSTMTLQAGAELSMTRSNYYKTINDLLGADYWIDTDKFSERDFPDNPLMLINDLNNPSRKVTEGDKFGYDYDINAIIGSIWLQQQVNLAHWDINYGIRTSYTQYQRDGKMRNGRAPKNSYGKGVKHTFDNAMLKVGATYKLDGHNYFVLNAAYGTRAPLADNVYISPRIKDDVAEGICSERFYTVDLSYGFNYNRFRGMVTGYWSNIYDGFDRMSFYDDNNQTFTNYVLSNVNKTYKGIELGVAYKVTPDITITLAGTVSKYQYKNRPKATRSFENGAMADTTQIVYLKNFYVGGTPQTAGSLSINYNAPKMWFFEVNGVWMGDAYIDLSPIRHEFMPGLASFVENKEQYVEKVEEITNQEKLRDAFVLNASVGKVIYFKKWSLNLNLSVNNILNKQNIQTGGYQQSRFDYTNYNVGKYPNRYYYSQGIRVFANVGVRF